MAAEGAGPRGRAAASPLPAHYFQPVSDRDVTVQLQIVAEEDTAAPKTRFAKRRRAAAVAATVARVVTIEAASQLLKSASPKFCAALERWSKDGKQPLRFECASEQEAEAWRHLLDCIHSMGRQLPPDLEAVLRLLLLAREQAAEPVVAACLRALHGKADQATAVMCLQLLTQLETGVSEHAELQALGDGLLVAAGTRLLQLLGEQAAVRADAAVQAQLLAYLGPLQHMLNDPPRRELFGQLPFELLRDCIFEDGNVDADAEVTVLAAFGFWAEKNLKQLNAGAVERVTAICSRVRLPTIPPSVLHNYWAHWPFLQQFDPTGDILTRAVVAAAEPQQLDMWAADLEAAAVDEEGQAGAQLTVAQFKAKCGSWRRLRQPQLGPGAAQADFAVEMGRGDGNAVYSARKYWSGYWWRTMIFQTREGGVYIFTISSVDFKGLSAESTKPELLTYGVRMAYGFRVDGSSASWSGGGTASFRPSKCSLNGWGPVKHGSQAVSWDSFWADGSPWLVNGTARLRFTLAAPA